MQELNSSNSINSNFQHLIQYDNETANIVNIPFYFKTESQMCLKQYYEDNIRYYLYHTKLDLKFHSAYHYVYLFTFGIILTCVNEKGLTIIKYTSLFSHRLKFDEKDRGLIHLVHYDNELTKKTETKFKCEEEDHSYYVYHFIKKHYVLSWQQLFEDTILSSSTQMYQYHFHVRKENRWGTLNGRVLLLSDKYIYSIKHNFPKNKLKLSKEGHSADAIKSVIKIDLLSNETELLVHYDKNENKNEHLKSIGNTKLYKSKKNLRIKFESNKDKDDFLLALSNLYFRLTEKYFPIKKI